jgi:hypothetical protein
MQGQPLALSSEDIDLLDPLDLYAHAEVRELTPRDDEYITATGIQDPPPGVVPRVAGFRYAAPNAQRLS